VIEVPFRILRQGCAHQRVLERVRGVLELTFYLGLDQAARKRDT